MQTMVEKQGTPQEYFKIAMKNKKIQVMIVDDHKMFVEGVQAIFSGSKDIEISTAIFDGKESFYNMALIAFVFIYYVISGLRRLIQFNINANEGEVEKYFTGIPTPLGAILLWVVYLIYLTGYINEHFVLGSIIIIGYLLNSKIKIKHL